MNDLNINTQLINLDSLAFFVFKKKFLNELFKVTMAFTRVVRIMI